jgi:predicted AAA+ superfamily ATPase
MLTDEATLQPLVDKNVTRSLIEHAIDVYDTGINRAEELNRELVKEYDTNVALLSVLRNERTQLVSTLEVIR